MRAAQRSTREAALDPARAASEAARLHAVARRGVAGPASAYPYGERIRAAFGRYAPAGLRAHFGQAARAASDALSARAFVWNGEAAFAKAPSLHTAAHEAAHLAGQARGAARLRHGVGAIGDAGERLADRAANAVAAGRSAEPLFDAAFAGAPATTEPAGLQMKNEIDMSKTKYTDVDSPWIEVRKGLDLTTEGYDKFMLAVNANKRYATMIGELKDTNAKAQSVTASIDKARTSTSEERAASDMQTAYGALGTFMTELTGTATPGDADLAKKMEFEGGHLISDKILGEDSYVQYNFAPQRGHLNHPIYRKIEEMAEEGTTKKDPSVTSPRPAWSMTTDLTYRSGKLKLKSADVMAHWGLDDSDLKKAPAPAELKLTHRVPWKWQATIDSESDDYVFSRTSNVDPTGTDPTTRSGAAFGFVPTEAEAEGFQKQTREKIDAVFWGMNTMKFSGATTTQLTTGSGSDRARKHTFTAVQSTPIGQTESMDPVATTLPTPKPPTVPKLKKTLSVHDLGEVTSMNSAKRKVEKLYKDDGPTISTGGFSKGALETAVFTAGKEYSKAKKSTAEMDLTSAMAKVRSTQKGSGTPQDRVQALNFVHQNFRTDDDKPAFSSKQKKEQKTSKTKKKQKTGSSTG